MTQRSETAYQVCKEIREAIEVDESQVEAARYIIKHLLKKKKIDPLTIESTEQAKPIVADLFYSFLAKGYYYEAAILAWNEVNFTTRPESCRMVWRAIADNPIISILGAGSMGKCLRKGTMIWLHNGYCKKIEDVKVGDVVLGADYTPRKVTNTYSGVDDLYKVRTLNGQGYICNSRHEITLKGGDGLFEVEAKKLGAYNTSIKWGNWIKNNPSLIPKHLPNGEKKYEEYSVSYWGRGDYYGITIEGDGRHLLEDFTVTHNTYTGAGFFLLDWCADPHWTCIKCFSATLEHAEKQLFATMKSLHSQSAIALPGIPKATTIMANKDSAQGIHLSAIAKGEDGGGKLRGLHPKPRDKAHPKFGTHSRVRIIGDEAEEIPFKFWEESDNILLGIDPDNIDQIKFFMATNPVEPSSPMLQRCEPEGGWTLDKIDSLKEWVSTSGYKCVRLDGADCENVKEGRVIYPGLTTLNGYKRLEERGDTDPTYLTMARGFPQVSGAINRLVPSEYVERSRGTYIFRGKTMHLLTADLSVEEDGDDRILTVSRMGYTDSWEDLRGRLHRFDDVRLGIQVDQQIRLKEGDTEKLGNEILEHARVLRVPPKCLAVDQTGVGRGVFHYLRNHYGPEVYGIDWGWAPTDKKILDDDDTTAQEQCSDIIAEMWWCTRQYMENDYIKIGPNVEMVELTKELSTRRYLLVKKVVDGTARLVVRVEPKKEYRKRERKSPDHADSFIMTQQVVRVVGGFHGSMLPMEEEVEEESDMDTIGERDKLEFIDMDD